MLVVKAVWALVLAAATALALVPSLSSTTTTRRVSVVEMRSGSQVKWQIRRKREQNQAKGRLRLNVFRSNNHIYAQVIDDLEGHTLCAASTLDAELKDKLEKTKNVEASREVGLLLAERLKEKNIDTLYYDRFSGSHKYLFHGRVKGLVDGVRDGGITI